MDREDQSTKYIALYALLYFTSFTIITALSSIFRTYIFYAATSLIVAAYTATKFAKKNKRELTSVEKIKIITGTFICTVAVNIFYTSNVIGAIRSLDSIDAGFVGRQLLHLFGLWAIFGTNYIYYSIKKQNKSQT